MIDNVDWLPALTVTVVVVDEATNDVRLPNSTIDARVDAMLQAGLVDEVRGLLAAGYSPDLPGLSAIGYREIIASFQGRFSLEQAVVEIKRNTRTFVRRQANWFKQDDPQIHWFEAGPDTLGAVQALVEQWLSKTG